MRIKKKKEAPPKTINFQPRTEGQAEYIRTIVENDITFCTGPAGSGKTSLAVAIAVQYLVEERIKKIVITRPTAINGKGLGYLPGPQPLDAKVLTPGGWKLMGDLKVGDLVFSRDGLPTKVLKIFPKGIKDVYKITTTDNRTTECCIDHLWYTQTFEDRKRKRKGNIKTTKEIIDTLFATNGKINHYLPRVEPIQFPKQELPIKPYTLGILLGDGYIGDAISFASMDSEIVTRVENELKEFGISLTPSNNKGKADSYHLNSHCKKNKPGKKVCIIDKQNNKQIFEDLDEAANYFNINKKTIAARCRDNRTIDNKTFGFIPLENRWSHPIKNICDQLGLSGKKAWEKFIPDIYKYSSIQDRLDILRGLMDTDGTVKKTGEASFCTTSKQLALDVREIVHSLGGMANIRERNRIGKQSKIYGHTATVRRISYEFTISLPENINPFFLKRKSEQFKTKYSHQIKIQSIEKVSQKEVQCILVENNEHLYVTDNFIVTHNSLEEKMGPYLIPIYDQLKKYFQTSDFFSKYPIGISSYKSDPKIEITSYDYVLGRTMSDAIIISDESQMANHEQLLSLITRLGEGSKMIINGDLSQRSIPIEKGMEHFIARLEGLRGVGVTRLGEEDIVRHKLIGPILNRLR